MKLSKKKRLEVLEDFYKWIQREHPEIADEYFVLCKNIVEALK